MTKKYSPDDFNEKVPEIAFEIRDGLHATAYKKVKLYERTLGIAVLPVLLRRLAIMLARKMGYARKR
ncbi:MAG: hypothetical protein FWC86_02375 [Coriobacteriia bacterium]|nr:hypothetical protein [Coriobacteriia bacterium]